MKRKLAMILAGALLLAGCTDATRMPPTTQKSGVQIIKTPGNSTKTPPVEVKILPVEPPVVARVDGQPITSDQLQKPLMEAYGLNVLMHVVKLELARREAVKAGVVISTEDIFQERQMTISKLFKDANEKTQDQIDEAVKNGETEKVARLQEEMCKDNEQMLDQFLARQHSTRTEFEMAIHANACMRKIAASLLKGKITEANLREAFGVLYGENVKVRHIQLANMQEVAEVRRRLEAGQPFEKVAMELSRDRQTAALGGELPLFSRNTPNMPEVFKQVAFALKVGEISEPVQAGEAYHLIKLEQRVPPKAVKFEDVKASVERELYERWQQATVNQLRQELANRALQTMQIEQPMLKRQFEERVSKQNAAMKAPEQVRREMELERKAATRPATSPAAAPMR